LLIDFADLFQNPPDPVEVLRVLSAELRKPQPCDNGFRDWPMDWVPVESSVLAAVRYSRRERSLYLKFHSGAVYRYFDFPHDQYSEFLAADSKGQYFNGQIRDCFQCQQVGRGRRMAG
jgi:hypothetical protein